MNFWERSLNFYNHFFDWLLLDDIGINAEESLISNVFGPEFPPLRQIASNISLVFVNSNQFLEFPRPISNKVVNIGGIVDARVEKLEEVGDWGNIHFFYIFSRECKGFWTGRGKGRFWSLLAH